jgi:hypothetical protein
MFYFNKDTSFLVASDIGMRGSGYDSRELGSICGYTGYNRALLGFNQNRNISTSLYEISRESVNRFYSSYRQTDRQTDNQTDKHILTTSCDSAKSLAYS